MAVRGLLSFLILASTLLSTPIVAQDFGDLLADVSTASIKGAAWLAEYSARKDLDLSLAEVAHIGAFYKLLYGHANINDGAIKSKICSSHRIHLKSVKTQDLLWYAIGCSSSQFCPQKTCPKSLAHALLRRLRYFPEKDFNHPVGLSLAIIAVSLYGIDVPWSHVHNLMQRIPLENETMAEDTHCYAILALSAIYDRTTSKGKRKELSDWLKSGLTAVNSSLTLKSSDNAMKNALLLQAKNAVGKALGIRLKYSYEGAIRRLLRFQKKDGAFDNSLTTVISLMALSGRSFLDLQQDFRMFRPNEVSEDQPLPNKRILTCFAIHFKDEPEANPPSQYIYMNPNSSAFDVLQTASKMHPCYGFSYQTYNWGVYLTRVCGVAQDHVGKKYWMLYVGNEPAKQSITATKIRKGHCMRLIYKRVKFS